MRPWRVYPERNATTIWTSSGSSCRRSAASRLIFSSRLEVRSTRCDVSTTAANSIVIRSGKSAARSDASRIQSGILRGRREVAIIRPDLFESSLLRRNQVHQISGSHVNRSRQFGGEHLGPEKQT